MLPNVFLLCSLFSFFFLLLLTQSPRSFEERPTTRLYSYGLPWMYMPPPPSHDCSTAQRAQAHPSTSGVLGDRERDIKGSGKGVGTRRVVSEKGGERKRKKKKKKKKIRGIDEERECVCEWS